VLSCVREVKRLLKMPTNPPPKPLRKPARQPRPYPVFHRANGWSFRVDYFSLGGEDVPVLLTKSNHCEFVCTRPFATESEAQEFARSLPPKFVPRLPAWTFLRGL
jgi:hypothetical protein